VEDPLFICEIAERFASEDVEDPGARGQVKQKNKMIMTRIGRVMEVGNDLWDLFVFTSLPCMIKVQS